MLLGTAAGKIKSLIFIRHLVCIIFYQLAMAAAASMPIMMWLFQSVANSLASTGKSNSTTTSNWYV